jgi:hypothetical protein
MPDRLISHATRKEQLTEIGLDPQGIAASVRDAVKANRPAVAAPVEVSINKHLDAVVSGKKLEKSPV